MAKRVVDYLRVSITDRCNLRCCYCMPDTGISMVSHKETLRYEELLRIVACAVRVGIQKVKVTGGEPLVRRGVLGFLEKLHEIEGIRPGNKAYWGRQAPVLFPIVGCLRDKKATFGNGKTCRMERHGIARKRHFNMTEQTDQSICFSLVSDEETLAQYPYRFMLTKKYTLDQNHIIVTYIIQNLDDDTLPFQIGGHPGFNCPLTNGERFEDYEVEFEEAETVDCPFLVPETGLVDIARKRRVIKDDNTLPMTHELFQDDALIFEHIKSKRVRLLNPKGERFVELLFQDFDNLLIWSSINSGPFVALEPWSGLATYSDESDLFEEKRGVYRLPPHQEKAVSYTITVG